MNPEFTSRMFLLQMFSDTRKNIRYNTQYDWVTALFEHQPWREDDDDNDDDDDDEDEDDDDDTIKMCMHMLYKICMQVKQYGSFLSIGSSSNHIDPTIPSQGEGHHLVIVATRSHLGHQVCNQTSVASCGIVWHPAAFSGTYIDGIPLTVTALHMLKK